MSDPVVTRAVLRAQLLDTAARLEATQVYVAHLELVIKLACEALNDNDEAGAYLILKHAAEAANALHDATCLQGLPVPAEPEVSPETGEDA